jgi:hypothetical protein
VLQNLHTHIPALPNSCMTAKQNSPEALLS